MTSRMMLFVVAYLAIVAAGISGTLFSAYLPVIVRDLTGAVDRESIARVGSSAGAAFLFGWAIGAILLGAIGDRIGRKMAFFTSVMVCTVGIVTTAWAPSVSMLIVIRFITGAGAGSSLLLGAVMVSEAWENKGRAWMMGILANAFPGWTHRQRRHWQLHRRLAHSLSDRRINHAAWSGRSLRCQGK